MSKLLSACGKFIFINKKLVLSLWLILLVLAILNLVFSKNINTENALAGAENTEAAEVEKLILENFNQKLGLIAAIVIEKKINTDELEKDLLINFPQIQNIMEIKGHSEHKNKLLYVLFNPEQKFVDIQALVAPIRDKLNIWSLKTGTKTYMTGSPAFQYDSDNAGKKDSLKSEIIALLISLFILVFNFGALVSGLLPLVVGVTTIIFMNSLLKILGLEYNGLSQILSGMVGLALAIDYSLFIVSRFKEEIDSGKTDAEAIEIVFRYSGKTIFVSSLIMICSISGLWLPDVSTSKTVVLSLIIVILVSMLNSLIILPALLLNAKNILDKPKFIAKMIRKVDKYLFWKKFAGYIVKHPKKYFSISIIILLLLSLPVLNLKLWEAVQTVTPLEAESMKGYEILREDNWGGELIPVFVIIKAKNGNVFDNDFISYMYDFTKAIKGNPHVESVQSLTSWNPGFKNGDYVNFFASLAGTGYLSLPNQFSSVVNTSKGNNMSLVYIFPKNLMNLEGTHQIISFAKNYAKSNPKYELLTGGVIARATDFTDELYRFVPHILFIIFFGIYLLLFFYMKSAILPLKAAIMNFLPILSAFGILTIIFQYGFLNTILNNQPGTGVINMVPIILFSITFGLSMDYEVLILSRISESYENTGDTKTAVVEGLARSGSLITGAVLILLGVFVPGIFSSAPMTKQICVGITSAILIDATVVRLLLVPSFMMLMGKWNWWTPFSK